MKKLMILGSSKYFENLVLSAKEEGIYTIVCDNKEGGPATKVCDEAITVDLLDLEALKKIAVDKKIDGIITSFGDILMKSYAYIANELNLPCVIQLDQLENVTNKKAMKEMFVKHHISTPEYCIVNDKMELEKLAKMKFPLVMKPLDSSGSKGVYFVNSMEEIEANIDDSISYSTDGKLIFEEFYESDEIQGLAWVHNGEAHVLYMGDRELVNIHKGRAKKPVRLIYPSKYCYQYEEEIKTIYQQIATAFEIQNGPLYIQMLVGADGIKVSEIMTRLPGGCDYLAVKQLTNFDAGKLFVKFSVGNEIDFSQVMQNNMRLAKMAYALPIYIGAGKIADIENIQEINSLEYVSSYLLHVKEGDEIKSVGDLRQDCGRVFGIANNIFDADKKMDYIHTKVRILDEQGKNMIQNF